MKRYTGKLSTTLKKRIKENAHVVKSILNKSLQGLGFVGEVMTLEESIAKYNKGISTDEIKAWVWYRQKQGIPMKGWTKLSSSKSASALRRLVKNKALFVIGENEYVPYPVFTYGNMYDRLLQVEKLKDYILENFSEAIYKHHIQVIENVKPKQLSITNPIASDRPRILAISSFSKTFEVSSLRDQSGVILNEAATLQEAFKDWLRALPETEFKYTKAYEIVNYYLNGDSKPRSLDKVEWRSIQKHSREEGEKLYTRFLHEAITLGDQQKIDLHWNRTYNGHSSLQHHKIPIGLEVSRSFHGFEFDIRPAQREGIAFMELVGSGIIAYDVGVGKTITAIIELANAIKTGKCSRPLVVVPNPTYKNWIKEMIGFEDKAGVLTGTDVSLNEWYNLGADASKGIDLSKKVKAKSITLVTYEGLMKIGFGQGVESELFMELSNILEQDKEESERDRQKRFEKYRELLGVGLKDTIADIEELGFDYIVIDEAHNFKNVFSEVKSEDKEDGGDGKKRFHITGGSPSNRAIKAFFLCNYIQRSYGRNVMLLSATPFTNSPLEIYSMLSLVGYHYLKSMGMYNIHKFFEQYILETTEYVVGVDGEIKESNVVKSFNNRVSLQKLIHNHINFKTGEEAGIPRPCKINLPKTTTRNDKGDTKKLKRDQQILTYLKMTPRQEINQARIAEEASKGASKDDPGRLLRVMGNSLNNALSPFLYDNAQPENYLDFVNESPKIQYTLECIRSVKNWHEKRKEKASGQVIYIDRGKEYFPLIKEYLEKELGYSKSNALIANPRQKVDEVEIITGGISQSKKEKIKTAFNEGTCKVLIGTSTIREGINLQKKGTVLYNLYPNWNPTDIRQLEGRIWRQKNEFGYVRISMPLIENSMDVFVFQKLEEKTSRINDIWAKSDRGNVLDEESLDTNEIKFALITDLGVLARFEVKQERKELIRKQSILDANIKDLKEFQNNYSSYLETRKRVLADLSNKMDRVFNRVLFTFIKSNGERLLVSVSTPLNNSDLNKLSKKDSDKLDRAKEIYEEAKRFTNDSLQEDKELIKISSKLNRLLEHNWDWELDKFKDYLSKYKKTERSLLEPRGYSINDDFQKIIADFEKEREQVNEDLETLNSPEHYEEVMNDIIERKKQLKIKGGSIEDRVKDFASLNHLLSYKFSDIDHTSCEIPTKEFTGRRNAQKEVRNNDQNNLLQLKSKSRKRRIRLLALK